MSTKQKAVAQPSVLGGDRAYPLLRRWPFQDAEPRTVLQTLIVMLTVFLFTQMFVMAGATTLNIEVRMRALLWLLIFVSVALHIVRRGVSDLVAPFGVFLPFFAVGVFSALISVEPVESARELIFWLLGVLAASAAGRQLGERLTGQMLFWGFAFSMLLSVVAAQLLPKVGLVVDLRAGDHGVWRGVYPGKNWLSWYAGFALLTAVTVKGVFRPLRALSVMLALVCAIFAHSSGGVAQMLLLVGFLSTVAVMRRMNLSSGLQALILLTGMLALIAFVVIAWTELLSVLGRDPTLTGRTMIWSLYLQRAMNSWLIGAGPGSFTRLSATTADIGMSLQALGDIQTPHNMYIAAFGEVGVLGALSLIGALIYFSFAKPFRLGGNATLMLAGVTFSLLVSGSSETHEVFGMGIASFMIVLINASLGRAEGGDALQVATTGRDDPVEGYQDDVRLYAGPHGPLPLA